MRFFIFFFVSFLYASNLVDIYRFDGEKNLINKIEQLLSSKKYWLERLKNKDVTWGYYSNDKNILVCVKAKKT